MTKFNHKLRDTSTKRMANSSLNILISCIYGCMMLFHLNFYNLISHELKWLKDMINVSDFLDKKFCNACMEIKLSNYFSSCSIFDTIYVLAVQHYYYFL